MIPGIQSSNAIASGGSKMRDITAHHDAINNTLTLARDMQRALNEMVERCSGTSEPKAVEVSPAPTATGHFAVLQNETLAACKAKIRTLEDYF